MKSLRRTMRLLSGFLQYGEIKTTAKKHGIDFNEEATRSRFYNIARGKIAPRESEIPFITDLILLTKPRYEETKTLIVN